MKFIDLFAGIGGFRLGLQKASNKFECVWSNEWLEKPRRIYAKHFGKQPDPRDIRTITARDIPDADLIVGGFPCATFSIAGKRTGFHLDDTRGTLCFEMLRLAQDKRIPYILFENVKGLLNHDRGRSFQVILSALDEMGYDAQWELLDSQNFGVPQHRERIFLIANLRGKSRPQVFPITEPTRNDIEGKKIQTKKVFGTLQARMRKGLGNTESRITSVLVDPENCEKVTSLDEILISQWRRGYFRDYKSKGVPTLTANMGTGGNNVPYIKQVGSIGNGGQGMRVYESQDGISPTLRGVGGGIGGKSALIVAPVLTPNRKEKRQNGRRFKNNGEPSFTLTAQDRHGIFNGKSIRKLTPLECERLQGLPDDYTKWLLMDDGILKQNSDADRYERCGRTVTIPVIEAIGKKLINV